MRILGLDLGSKTLGVSVSDALGMIARPVETIRFESDDYEAACEQVQPYICLLYTSICGDCSLSGGAGAGSPDHD